MTSTGLIERQIRFNEATTRRSWNLLGGRTSDADSRFGFNEATTSRSWNCNSAHPLTDRRLQCFNEATPEGVEITGTRASGITRSSFNEATTF